MGSGFSKIKKQARMMQQQLSHMKESLAQVETSGSAGNGLVVITLSGERQLKRIKIDPSCVTPSDVEGLEDLILAAYNDASQKLAAQSGALQV
jgi:DNA-binding YbaB/EbfC family protein